MQYLLIVSIICLSGLIGDFIAKSYVYRDLFFKEMINFFNYFKNVVAFRSEKISNVFEEYKNICDKRFIKSIMSLKKLVYLEDNSSEENLKELYFLKSEEKNTIVKFMKEVGKNSKAVECENIQNLINYLESKKNDVELIRKKNETMIYKLSVLFGVLVCILIL